MPRPEQATSRSNGDSTRSRILASAAALFAERGYAATSVRMVARSLGLSDPAVHYHFPSKQALYLALLSQPDYGLLPLDQHPLTRESIIDQILHLANWWLAHPGLGQIVVRGQLSSDEPSLQYLEVTDQRWEALVCAPLIELLGDRGRETADLASDLLWGVYSDAIFAFGDGAREVAEQAYFQDRLRQLVSLTIPEVP